MTEMRFFRSATHPEFMEYEIKPLLAMAGLSTEFAEIVAKMVDAFGYAPEDAIARLREAAMA